MTAPLLTIASVGEGAYGPLGANAENVSFGKFLMMIGFDRFMKPRMIAGNPGVSLWLLPSKTVTENFSPLLDEEGNGNPGIAASEMNPATRSSPYVNEKNTHIVDAKEKQIASQIKSVPQARCLTTALRNWAFCFWRREKRIRQHPRRSILRNLTTSFLLDSWWSTEEKASTRVNDYLDYAYYLRF